MRVSYSPKLCIFGGTPRKHTQKRGEHANVTQITEVPTESHRACTVCYIQFEDSLKLLQKLTSATLDLI